MYDAGLRIENCRMLEYVNKPSIIMEGFTNFDSITLNDSVSLFATC